MKNRSIFARLKAGLTLVDLVIVVLILGILAAAATPRFLDTKTDAKTSGTRQSMKVGEQDPVYLPFPS